MSNILKRRGKEKRKKLEAGLAGDMLPPGTMLVSFKKYMLDEPDSIDRVLDYLNIRSAILSGLVADGYDRFRIGDDLVNVGRRIKMLTFFKSLHGRAAEDMFDGPDTQRGNLCSLLAGA